MKTNSHSKQNANKNAARRLSEQVIQRLSSLPPELSLRELQDLTAIPYNTICDWRGGKHHDVLRLVLLKLGLAREVDRAVFLFSLVPQHATLSHAFFGPDPVVREKLTRLVTNRTVSE